MGYHLVNLGSGSIMCVLLFMMLREFGEFDWNEESMSSPLVSWVDSPTDRGVNRLAATVGK